jgi:hypothetical protein
LSGAAAYKNAVVRILGVREQIREDKYDHCRATRLSFFFRVSLRTTKARPLRLHFRIHLSTGEPLHW